MTKRKMHYGLPGALMLIILSLMFTGCSPQTGGTEPAQAAPATAPDTVGAGESASRDAAAAPYNQVMPFELPDLDGNMVSVSDFEGKYVLINFWATWCAYCDQEMPDLQKLQDKYGDDLIVLLVNVQENEEVIKSYLEKKNLTMLTVLDKKGNVASMYNVTGMPSSYFVTPDQRVIGYVAGMMTYETMEKSLDYVREQYESTK